MTDFPARVSGGLERITWHDADGVAHELVADKAGLMHPDSREADEVATAFGLAVQTTSKKAPADPAKEG